MKRYAGIGSKATQSRVEGPREELEACSQDGGCIDGADISGEIDALLLVDDVPEAGSPAVLPVDAAFIPEILLEAVSHGL